MILPRLMTPHFNNVVNVLIINKYYLTTFFIEYHFVEIIIIFFINYKKKKFVDICGRILNYCEKILIWGKNIN